MPLRWWNPTSVRVLQREPAPSARVASFEGAARKRGRKTPRFRLRLKCKCYTPGIQRTRLLRRSLGEVGRSRSTSIQFIRYVPWQAQLVSSSRVSLRAGIRVSLQSVLRQMDILGNRPMPLPCRCEKSRSAGRRSNPAGSPQRAARTSR